jgi:hypothetical protein
LDDAVAEIRMWLEEEKTTASGCSMSKETTAAHGNIIRERWIWNDS